MHFLVVDPDAGFREELHNFLLSAGHQHVILAGSLRHATRVLARRRFDAVIVAAALAEDPASLRGIRESCPRAMLIVLLDTEDEVEWIRDTWGSEGVYFLLRCCFQRRLLLLLKKGGPP